MNEVFETEMFSKVYGSLEQREKEWVDKMKDQLAESLDVGKILKYDWFREKKYENKRLYYIINRKSKKALLVAFGSKKEQQLIIAHILLNQESYLSFIS